MWSMPSQMRLQTSLGMAEEQGVGVRWLPAYENMNPGAEDRQLLKDATEQHSEDRD